MTGWTIDQTSILGRSEITRVIAELKRLGKRSRNARMNLAIFRLSTCCGLRVSEIVGLRLSDVRVGLDRPYVNIPKTITKGYRGKYHARKVPLWWDRGTLDDLTAWKNERVAQGAKPGDRFVCSQAAGALGHRMHRDMARRRFIRSCAVLGPERKREVTIHTGRHSFGPHVGRLAHVGPVDQIGRLPEPKDVLLSVCVEASVVHVEPVLDLPDGHRPDEERRVGDDGPDVLPVDAVFGHRRPDVAVALPALRVHAEEVVPAVVPEDAVVLELPGGWLVDHVVTPQRYLVDTNVIRLPDSPRQTRSTNRVAGGREASGWAPLR